jgi:hypothetical protein
MSRNPAQMVDEVVSFSELTGLTGSELLGQSRLLRSTFAPGTDAMHW